MADKSSNVTVKKEAVAPAEEASAEASAHPIISLRREMERLFDRFESGFGARGLWPFDPESFGAPWAAFKSGAPAVDLSETETEYRLTADLPGVEEKDMEVKLSDGVLTIKGERSEETKKEEKDYHLSERRYGSFQRSLRVPASVDQDKITASFAKGVLSLVMPKTKEAQQKVRKIDVKAG
jgi:HSP20 family protein